MCGIVGYIGGKDASPILLDAIRRLEYRGYDSAGMAAINKNRLEIRRAAGKISLLEKAICKNPVRGKMGLAHTRWATHGRPSKANAHPHLDCTGTIAVVHNGIIENYSQLKKALEKKGHRFKSETDTEVIAHLIEENYKDGIEKAVAKSLGQMKGSYALGVISLRDSDRLVAARKGSPLIIGLGDNENFIASDVPAILAHTRRIIYLEDGEIAVLSKEGIKLSRANGKAAGKNVILSRTCRISWNAEMAEKEGCPHFMLKEIHEQPRAIEDTIRGRLLPDRKNVCFEELEDMKGLLSGIDRIIITACGTSWHAGLVGEYLIEDFARIPVEVENAAEFRYRRPIIEKDTLVISISQSGETADTLGAIREVHDKKGTVVSICNVVGSSIARESDRVIYTHAGPEIGVASTKAFTTQLCVLYMLGIYLGRMRGTLKAERALKMINSLKKVSGGVRSVLGDEKRIKKLAGRFYKKPNFLYLGRGKGYPVAMEGALKLKEVSYIHAEGYPAAEMKHGPIALIDHNMPVVVLALKGRRYDKIVSNIEEVKSRKGILIALASEGDTGIKKRVDEVIYLPTVSTPVSPIIAVVPLQLLAYYIAVKRGCNPDQPRHLAKSVTVE